MKSRILRLVLASSWLAIGCNNAVSEDGGVNGSSGASSSGSGSGSGSSSSGSTTTGGSGSSGSGSSSANNGSSNSSSSSSGSNSSGSGSSSGGSSGTGQTPTEAQLCGYIWQGAIRADVLVEATLASSLLHPPTGTYCPTPTTPQANVIADLNAAISNEMLNLPPPDGGWPDGSGPTVCETGDTSSSVVQLANAISASLVAGRVAWSPTAAATCAQGMQATEYLLVDAGLPAGSAPVGPDGGPCEEILIGQVAVGGACTFSFDCQSGLYCRPGGGNSCSGSCAAPVPTGQSCGPYDLCASGGSCSGGTCSAGSTTTPAGPGTGGPGTPCSETSDCQNCLNCNYVSDGGMVCVGSGLLGATCQADGDCATPLLYCNQGTCAPSGIPGDTGCLATSDNSCLIGWCQPAQGSTPSVCVGSSSIGGPCVDDHSCSSGYCSDGGSALGACAGDATQGQSCASAPCGSDLYCDQTTQLCEATLGGGAICTSGDQCQSSSCVNGQCASPCVSGCGSNCFSGPDASLLLGLGGAMTLQRRRRREKSADDR